MSIVPHKTVALLALIGATQACAPHIVFPRGLTRTAPLADRIAFYERFHSQQRTSLLVYTPNSVAPALHRSTVDGQEVYNSEDLVPLVGRRSRVARHSRAAIRGEVRGGWVIAGGGVAMLAGSLSMGLLSRHTGLSGTEGLAVGLSLLGAGSVSALVGWILRLNASAEREAAYDAFDDDLRRRLGLCQRVDLEVVDCAASPRAPTTR